MFLTHVQYGYPIRNEGVDGGVFGELRSVRCMLSEGRIAYHWIPDDSSEARHVVITAKISIAISADPHGRTQETTPAMSDLVEAGVPSV